MQQHKQIFDVVFLQGPQIRQVVDLIGVVFSVAERFHHAEDPSDNLAGAMPGHDRLLTALPLVSHPGGDVSSPTRRCVRILLPARGLAALS